MIVKSLLNRHCEDYELLSSLKRSRRWMEIVGALSGPTTPTEIAGAVGVSVSHVSKTLADFDEMETAVCKTLGAKIERI